MTDKHDPWTVSAECRPPEWAQKSPLHWLVHIDDDDCRTVARYHPALGAENPAFWEMLGTDADATPQGLHYEGWRWLGIATPPAAEDVRVEAGAKGAHEAQRLAHPLWVRQWEDLSEFEQAALLRDAAACLRAADAAGSSDLAAECERLRAENTRLKEELSAPRKTSMSDPWSDAV